MDRESTLVLAAAALAVIAAVMDVRQHRIPNWLTYSGVLLGPALRTLCFGRRGLVSAILGGVMVGGTVFLFYALRTMGAGDVKLLAAMGSLVGWQHAALVLFATAISGGLLALAYAIYRRRLGTVLTNVGWVLQFHWGKGFQPHPELNLDNPSALRMPYGLAIASGTLCSFLATWWR